MRDHLLDAGTDVVAVPGHEHLWVEFKREATYHDELRLSQIRGELLERAEKGENGERKLDASMIAEWVIAKAAVMVLGWNLGDQDGNTLPVSVESIMKLRPAVIGFLGDEAARRMAGRPEEKEVPFVKPSRRSSRRAKA